VVRAPPLPRTVSEARGGGLLEGGGAHREEEDEDEVVARRRWMSVSKWCVARMKDGGVVVSPYRVTRDMGS
jgi:hypothetical protein